jgi:hypothetical protein
MTAPIEDVSSLPGKQVTDQDESPIGKITDIYATEGDGHPSWVTVEASFSGVGNKRLIFIPLARLKDENGSLRVPYSKNHISETPEVDAEDGLSEECEAQLRAHYGIDRGDQELRSDNKSYATMVPEETGALKKAEDVDQLETPNADTRTDETRERLQDPGSAEIRKVTADDVVEGDDGDSDDREESKSEEGSDGQEEAKSEEGSRGEGESGSETKGESGSEGGGGESGSETKGESGSGGGEAESGSETKAESGSEDQAESEGASTSEQ